MNENKDGGNINFFGEYNFYVHRASISLNFVYLQKWNEIDFIWHFP